MSTSCSDVIDELSQNLADAGYTFHEREVTQSGEDAEEEEEDYTNTVYWFVWGTEGAIGYEVGDDCDTELDATWAAMNHWFANAKIPSKA